MRLRYVCVLAISFLFLQPIAALAQCGFTIEYATPIRYLTYYIDPSVPSNKVDDINAAADMWNNAVVNPNIGFTPGGAGSDIRVFVDTNYAGNPGSIVTGGPGSHIRLPGSGAGRFDLMTWTFTRFVMLHEFGHQLGFGHSPCDASQSVMAETTSFNWVAALDALSNADSLVTSGYYPDPDPNCNPTECSPITLDLDLDGILTFTEPSVLFDMRGLGVSQLFGWTSTTGTSGLLFLDRNGDGLVSDGRELFGNVTPLSWGYGEARSPDGFYALGWFDKAAQAGNDDGYITAADEVFGSLRVWVDSDGDGVCQISEVSTLSEVGTIGIALDAAFVHLTDPHGNVIKRDGTAFKSSSAGVVPMRAVDVFFATLPAGAR